MTREEFERIEEDFGFDEAMDELYQNENFVTNYNTLKEFAIDKIRDDDINLGLHILNAIYESTGNSEWFYYDFTAGTCCTPICLNNADDVETHIGFEEEEI